MPLDGEVAKCCSMVGISPKMTENCGSWKVVVGWAVLDVITAVGASPEGMSRCSMSELANFAAGFSMCAYSLESAQSLLKRRETSCSEAMIDPTSSDGRAA